MPPPNFQTPPVASGSGAGRGHAAVSLHAGMVPQRSTTDVDMVLHIETTMSWARGTQLLQQRGYTLQIPTNPMGAAHRFVRDHDVIDALITDHMALNCTRTSPTRGSRMRSGRRPR